MVLRLLGYDREGAMGTVGLSFGSPTSGAGFDVSSTVAQIVGNLRNVETPWNTQLTTLHSQDTTISSLGTLYSSLSNDLSALTELNGIMSQKTGSSSDTNVLTLTAANASAVAGTHTVTVTNLAQTASGYLAPITKLSDTLSGSISLQAGSGKAQTITLNSSNNTLSGLATAINASGVGIMASVLTDSSGSRLSLVSSTSGKDGGIVVDPALNTIIDTSSSNAPLAYTGTATGKDALLTIDGIKNLTSSSNTVANLIPGITFQLLAPSAAESDNSLEQVQVVIGNDNSGVESTFSQMVSDYNSLISAINTQEGNDSSGNAEPLYGSPTLSLLQQQLMSGLNMQNPNGSLDSIAANTNTTLGGSISIAVGSGVTDTFVVGAGTNTANTFYTGSGNNTLADLASAINAANSGATLSYLGAAGSSTGALAAVGSGTALSGTIAISVGSGAAENFVLGTVPDTGAVANTIYSGSDNNTLSGLADAINQSSIGVTASVTTDANGQQTLTLTTGTTDALTATSGIVAAGPGVTANVVTSNGLSTLALTSQTAGAKGALATTSSIVATSDTPLSYSGSAGTSTANSTGTLTAVAKADDTLSGSITIEAGSGTAMEFDLSTLSDKTLGGLSSAINNASIGVTASVVTNNDGTSSLSLLSETAGTAGNLTVSSSLLDTIHTSSSTLSYTNSSDINNLTSLGISVNNNGTLTFDAASLDSVLNSDYSSVAGFFQNANSWGQTFSAMLTSSGTSSVTGILSLAATSNSSIESTLNADISKEEILISVQQKNLTAELNSANEIMQMLPSQLNSVNELYSAITGYNQSQG